MMFILFLIYIGTLPVEVSVHFLPDLVYGPDSSAGGGGALQNIIIG